MNLYAILRRSGLRCGAGMSRVRLHLTYANVLSTLCLFLLLGGAAYAVTLAKKNSVTSKSIKNGQVKTRDLAKNAVKGAQVADESLTGNDIDASTLGQVSSALSASHADSATNADHATSADSATNATDAAHATTADTASTANSATPSGSAGGDLTGTYPNPSIATGAVGPSQLGTIPQAEVGLTSVEPVASDIANITPVSFDTAVFDTDHLFDASHPSHLTAPIAGVYQINAGARWQNNATGVRFLAICVNGDPSACDANHNKAVSEIDAVAADGGTRRTQQTVSALLKLSANDQVSAAAAQDSGGALNLDGLPATFLSMTWVGSG